MRIPWGLLNVTDPSSRTVLQGPGAANARNAELGPDGVRVNAISAGPIKTLAASGISDFRYILKWNEYNSPLRRTVTIEDVGGGALYLALGVVSAVLNARQTGKGQVLDVAMVDGAASLMSMFVMFACGYGLRTMAAYSIPGRLKSSTNTGRCPSSCART